ncbi:MAG: 50S ribosomal protein L4 [Bacteroidia bacterium]|nr:50S ribosomal protein L4 [Bacteroidia bacterium]
MELAIYNIQGKETGKKVTLSKEVFGIEPNDHAVYLDVKQYLANQRQGTHKAKERAEIARTTKKAFRQKGTGGARRGSYKSPIVRGGGRVFGPRPRNYSFKLNRKLKQLARRSALSTKAAGGFITVIDNVNFDAPKAKAFREVLKNFGFADTKTLWILPENNQNVVLSARNFKGANVITASDLNTYAVMNAQRVVLAEGSLSKIEELLIAK